MKNVCVTGLGVLATNGCSLEDFWASIQEPAYTITEASNFAGSGILAGELPSEVKFADLPRAKPTVCDRASLMGVAAADKALGNARLAPGEPKGERVAVIMGNSAGGQASLEEQYVGFYREGQLRPSPLGIAKFMPSSVPSWISMAFGFCGPTFSVNSACASATHAIGVAAQMIENGLADVAIAGGAEACLTNGVLRAWHSMGILAPDACRPFSRHRKGLVLSEGAGVLVLESRAHAAARGADTRIRLAGYGCSADARDLTKPDAAGMARAMAGALADAGVSARDIDYINAHGTGTIANDRTEVAALKTVFDDDCPAVSSTKGVHGHALGAAGGLEAVATVLAMLEGKAPPTANFEERDPACDIDIVTGQSRSLPIGHALANSFAFGGLNASLVFERAG